MAFCASPLIVSSLTAPPSCGPTMERHKPTQHHSDHSPPKKPSSTISTLRCREEACVLGPRSTLKSAFRKTRNESGPPRTLGPLGGPHRIHEGATDLRRRE